MFLSPKMTQLVGSSLHCPNFFFKLEDLIVLFKDLLLQVNKEGVGSSSKCFLNAKQSTHDLPFFNQHISKHISVPSLGFCDKT